MNFAGCSVTEGERYTKDVKLRAGAKLLVKWALHRASNHYISNGKKNARMSRRSTIRASYCVMFARHGLPGVLLCCVLWALWYGVMLGGSIPPRFLFILNLSFNMCTFGLCASLYVCIAVLKYLGAEKVSFHVHRRARRV